MTKAEEAGKAITKTRKRKELPVVIDGSGIGTFTADELFKMLGKKRKLLENSKNTALEIRALEAEVKRRLGK